MPNFAQQTTQTPVQTDATESTQGQSSSTSNTAQASAASSARSISGPFRSLVAPVLAGEDPRSNPAFALSAYNTRYNTRASGEGTAVASVTQALRDAGKATLAELFAQVVADADRDRPGLDRLGEDVGDLMSGGDLAYNSRDITINYAQLSRTGKRWVRESQIGIDWMARTLRPYIGGGSIRDHALALSSDVTLLSSAEDIVRISQPRIDACKSILHLLRTGRLGASARSTGDRGNEQTNTPTAEASEGGEATAVEQGPTAAQEARATVLAERIEEFFPSRQRGNDRQTTDPSERHELLAEIQAEPEEVRDLIYANGDLMAQLTNFGEGSEALAVMRSLDSVESLYLACIRDLDSANRLQLIKAYLLARPGDAKRSARNRVLGHTLLMTQVVGNLSEEASALVYRLIVRGTEQLGPVDRLHKAARAQNGSDAAEALMELSSSDPEALKALEMDAVFRNSISRLRTEVVVSGLPVIPYNLCMQLWGRPVGGTYDPGRAGQPIQEDVNGDGRPLNIEERQLLDRELFKKYAKRIRDETDDTWGVNDGVIRRALESFERTRNAARLLPLVRRLADPPGQMLAQSYSSMYGRDLRSDIRSGCDDDVQRMAQRILDVRIDTAATGHVDGEIALAEDNANADQTDEFFSLDQALGEIMWAGDTVSTQLERIANSLHSEFGEFWGADIGDVETTGDRLRTMWAAIGEDLKTRTGLRFLHWSELIRNAFSAVGGSLKDRIGRCFRGKKAKRALVAVGLDGSSVSDREASRAETLRSEAENTTGEPPSESEAAQPDFTGSAQALFDALAGLSARSTDAQLSAAATLASQYLGHGENAVCVEGEEQQQSSVASSEGSKEAFYRSRFGLAPELHVLRVARQLSKVRGNQRSASEIAAFFGLSADAIGAPIAAPTDEERLVIDDSNRAGVRSEFNVGTARTQAREIWRLLHQGGQLHLINARLYGPHTDEEQRLIRVAFRQLSGGVDFLYYLRQLEYRRNNMGMARVGTYDDEGSGDGDDALEGIANRMGTGERSIEMTGSASELMISLEVATKGEVDNVDALRAAAINGDEEQIFATVEDLTVADRRRVLGDDELMGRLQRATGSSGWTRVHAVLIGDSDLVHRLESRTGWNDDEEGMRDDVTAYVERRRRKHVADVREDPSLATDATAQTSEVRRRVEVDCAHLLANESVAGVINDVLSGYELSQVNGILYGLGTEHATTQVLRDGDWSETEDDIIASIRNMPLEERVRLRNDPEYLRRLGDLCSTGTQFRDAMNALMNEQGAPTEPGGGVDHLSRLDEASRGHHEDITEMAEEEDEIVENLLNLTEEEYRRLLANPRLRAQILNAVEGDSEQARVQQLLNFRFPAVVEEENAGDVAGGGPFRSAPATASAPALTKEDRATLSFLEFQAKEKLFEGGSRSWDELLRASIEVYNLDFEGERAQPQSATQSTTISSTPTTAPTTAAAAPTSETSSGPDRAQPSRKELRQQEGARRRANVWRGAERLATGSYAGSPTRKQIIEDAVKKVRDPSTSRLRENVGFWNDDETEIMETLRNASTDVLIAEWTSVTNGAARSNKPTMKSVWEDYRDLRDAETVVGDDDGDAAGEQEQVENAPAQNAPAQNATPQNAGGGQPTQREMPEIRSPLSTKLLAFMNYTIDLSSGFQNLLIRHAGGLGSNGSESQTTELDNTEWHEWADIVRDRIPTLPSNKLAEALGIPTTDPDYSVVGNPNRTALTRMELRRQRYLRQAGSNYSNNFAGDEFSAMNVAMTRYGRGVADSQVNEEGGHGIISAGENQHLEETYGEDVDKAIKGYKEAKAAIANWASLIIGVVIAAAITILTAGAGGGVAGMFLMAMVTGAASAGGAALTKEMIQEGDYGSDQAITEIAQGAIMGAITAGSAYYAQTIFRSMAGLSSAARAAAVAQNSAPAPLYARLAAEAGEEFLSEGLNFGADSLMVLLDPNTWEEGWSEGRRQAQSQISEKLAALPGNALRAGITVFAAGAVNSRLPGNNNPAGTRAGEMPGVNRGRNAATLLRDQPSAFVEGGITVALDAAASGDFNIEDLPADLARAHLEETREGMIMSHVATAHAGTSARWHQSNIEHYGSEMTVGEIEAYTALNQVERDNSSLVYGGDEVGTNVRVSAEQFVNIRQMQAEAAVARWEESAGRELTPRERAVFLDYAREARNPQEFAARLGEDPQLVGARETINSDAEADAESEFSESQFNESDASSIVVEEESSSVATDQLSNGEEVQPGGGHFGGPRQENALDLMTDPNPPPEIAALQQELSSQSENLQLIDAEYRLPRLRQEMLARRATEVESALGHLGPILGEDLTSARLGLVFDYLFQSRGIGFYYDNYAAWRRIAEGMGTGADLAFVVHELAELAALDEMGFSDVLGADVDPNDEEALTAFRDDFIDAYMIAHARALVVEATHVAGRVLEMTSGAVDLSAEELAASDRGRRQQYGLGMIVDGTRFAEHPDYDSFDRSKEKVKLSPIDAARLGLSENTQVDEVILAVKNAAADPSLAFDVPDPALVLEDGDPLLTETIELEGREEMRDAWVEKILSHGQATEGTPKLILMGGGGASGKGFVGGKMQESGVIDTSGAVHIDPDEIKKMIPEYSQIMDMGDSRAAGIVHEESSMVSKRAISEAYDSGFNIVMDVTLGNPGKAMKLIERAKSLGYEVQLIGVTVDPELAVSRNSVRARKTGRLVPTPMLLSAHRGFSEGFEAYAGLVDSAVLYDTSEGGPEPALVAQKKLGGELEVVVEDLYDRFQAKRSIDPKAKGSSTLYADRPEMTPAPESKEAYVAAAMNNLKRTSRTAAGVLDMSASKDKGSSMAEGLDAQGAAKLAVDNVEQTVGDLYDERDSKIGSPADLRAFVERAAAKINQGILKKDALIREHDSDKYPYTNVSALEGAMEQFYQEFHQRLQDPNQDPIALAAWVEYRIDLTDHFFADGCGKVSKAISAWVLMRNRKHLPSYPENRKEIFARAPVTPRQESESVDAGQQMVWEDFYRSLFPEDPIVSEAETSSSTLPSDSLSAVEKLQSLPSEDQAIVEATREELEKTLDED